MGDSDEGSMRAAQGAQAMSQTGNTQPKKRGVLARIFGKTKTVDTSQGSTAPEVPVKPMERPGMINLRRKAVEDVMVPKAEIVSVPVEIGKEELVQVFRESGFTRIPVYEDTLDTPVGMAHLKDLALEYGFNGGGGVFDLRGLLRPLFFVPPSMPIGVLLQKMQSERRHMALVIDEYGGVDGLVTIEDLIEQVVGEIEDEHDIDEDIGWSREAEGIYLVDAKCELDAFEKETGLSLTDSDEIDEEEIDTLGGLVFMLLGRVPVRGEVVEHPGGTVIEVIDADPRRIKRLRVRLPGYGDE